MKRERQLVLVEDHAAGLYVMQFQEHCEGILFISIGTRARKKKRGNGRTYREIGSQERHCLCLDDGDARLQTAALATLGR